MIVSGMGIGLIWGRAMNTDDQELPETLKTILNQEIWQAWSAEQRAYILAHGDQGLGSVRFGEHRLPAEYSHYQNKQWQLGQARPSLQESCPQCQFAYCFYAHPRNWSMGATSDVWNLMKCANVDCQSYFESCL